MLSSLNQGRSQYFPLGGTDFLELWTDATIELGGVRDTFEMIGTFVVSRSNPNPQSRDKIITQILAMNLHGESKVFGPMVAYLNPQEPTFGDKAVALAPTETQGVPTEKISYVGEFGVMFEFRSLATNLTLFNKEPIHIIAQTDNLPPIGALGVSPEGTEVALYDRAHPDAPPVGKMLSTRKRVGAYIDLAYSARFEDAKLAAFFRLGHKDPVK